jgi:hypothetical protein
MEPSDRKLTSLLVLSGSLFVGVGTASAHSTQQRAVTCKVGYYRNVSGHCVRRPG